MIKLELHKYKRKNRVFGFEFGKAKERVDILFFHIRSGNKELIAYNKFADWNRYIDDIGIKEVTKRLGNTSSTSKEELLSYVDKYGESLISIAKKLKRFAYEYKEQVEDDMLIGMLPEMNVEPAELQEPKVKEDNDKSND